MGSSCILTHLESGTLKSLMLIIELKYWLCFLWLPSAARGRGETKDGQAGAGSQEGARPPAELWKAPLCVWALCRGGALGA